MWQIEKIENTHCIFLRVHKDFISSKDNLPKASAFTNTPAIGDNLSCDWCKYCSAITSRELLAKQKKKDGTFKNPLLFFIWRLNVGEIREKISPNQIVNHDPIFENPENEFIPNNRAHSIIIGEKPVNNAEFRVQLLRVGNWAICPV
jgi:hypothetical protein